MHSGGEKKASVSELENISLISIPGVLGAPHRVFSISYAKPYAKMFSVLISEKGIFFPNALSVFQERPDVLIVTEQSVTQTIAF